MPFKAHLKDIELDSDEVVRLLKVVREMWDRNVVPQRKDGCGDCRQLGDVVKLLNNDIILS